MTQNHPIQNAGLAATATLAATTLQAAPPAAVTEAIEKITSADDAIRGPAWQAAGALGAPAVQPLAEVMKHQDFEIARAGRRALWKIVRHAGRPGAQKEAQAVAAQLLPLLAEGNANLRRAYVWMLSEIGDDKAVDPLAALLSDQDLREDARAALQRIPGKKSLAALQSALQSAPEEFKPAIAVSLRVRGVQVRDYPSEKLVPTKKTNVKAVPA